uniref:DUF4116 domain-containing protein n=1 Tax=Alexandrium andersonii TaxID=327968 RepID=A0A7S2BRU1_9DINO|mmetsp:Transcript_29196/g.66170  ORF Transcript_29196/g.66170 Transcript_29196/m.66170 type:complete len:384 (+) Transcript_29196:3-1154(+)
MGDALSSSIDAVNEMARDLAFTVHHMNGLIVLVALIAVAFATRGLWGQPCWKATLGQIACPDPRNLVLCGCFPCGWCIMNVCCPWVCPRYHPLFRLRVVIVKARHLRSAAVEAKDKGLGSQAVFAEVEAGFNPAKTTSAQTYNHLGNDTVWWNEPIDLVMYPSVTTIHIDLYRKGTPDVWLGSLDIPVDSFYEPPGTLGDCTLCGRSCAKVCNELCGTEYKWPFVRGAPTHSEWRLQSRQWIDHCAGNEEKQRWAELGEIGRTAMFSSSSAPPGQTRWSRLSEQKFQAIQQVNVDGASLRGMPDALRADKDVVMAAVKQDADALRFAAPSLQRDPAVQRAAADVPEPMILPINHDNADVGRLWVYFVMYSMDEPLPPKMLLDV